MVRPVAIQHSYSDILSAAVAGCSVGPLLNLALAALAQEEDAVEWGEGEVMWWWVPASLVNLPSTQVQGVAGRWGRAMVD